MTTYSCWFEGYRTNENPTEIEAESAGEAAEKFSDAAFWDMDRQERSDWLNNSKTVFVQGRGDDTAQGFVMSCECNVEWWADEL